MLFPLGAWCPSLGKKGKGKEVGHQGNRLYSYSTYVPYITYVLKSIHKRCSPVFWLPLCTQLPRRLILGNLHSYTRIPIRYRGVSGGLDQRAS